MERSLKNMGVFCLWLAFFLCFIPTVLFPAASFPVMPGIDVLLTGQYDSLLKGKRIGIIANQTSINCELKNTVDLLIAHSRQAGYRVAALFAPEHGFSGVSHAGEAVQDSKTKEGIPIFSLHGKTKRPTAEMSQQIDVFLFDIQDIGSRSYTYISTLFYCMEEAKKLGKAVIVLDRPNPINGLTVDGPLMKEELRSFVGYINVPYCHGMTVGELARFFNEEHKVGCELHVIPMKGWRREMSFKDTGLWWVPTSPHIPEPSTVWFYPTTGILGELQIVSIGVGYTLPFKVIGAPWINASEFCKFLNAQKFPGVAFHPFCYKPFYGAFANQDCQGALIVITDEKAYLPVSTQYLIVGTLKSLYEDKLKEALKKNIRHKEMFCKVNGTEEVWRLLNEERYIVWKLRSIDSKGRKEFLKRRSRYLIPEY